MSSTAMSVMRVSSGAPSPSSQETSSGLLPCTLRIVSCSRFAGSAEEIEGAVLINPFNVDGFVAAIRTALEMPGDERRQRMRGMREQLRHSTIFDWLDSILARSSEIMADQASDHAAV